MLAAEFENWFPASTRGSMGLTMESIDCHMDRGVYYERVHLRDSMSSIPVQIWIEHHSQAVEFAAGPESRLRLFVPVCPCRTCAPIGRRANQGLPGAKGRPAPGRPLAEGRPIQSSLAEVRDMARRGRALLPALPWGAEADSPFVAESEAASDDELPAEAEASKVAERASPIPGGGAATRAGSADGDRVAPAEGAAPSEGAASTVDHDFFSEIWYEKCDTSDGWAADDLCGIIRNSAGASGSGGGRRLSASAAVVAGKTANRWLPAASQQLPKRSARQQDSWPLAYQEFRGRTLQAGSIEGLAQKADVMKHLAALALPYNALVSYVRETERKEADREVADQVGADRAEPGYGRRQIYSPEFAARTLLHTAGQLARGRRMTPQRAVEMFGPGPSSSAGPGVFLASSPRLCDRWPTPEAVEESLSDGFVKLYLVSLLREGRESELGVAAMFFQEVLLGWADRLKRSWGRLSWAPALSDIATALLCMRSEANSPGNLEALARVQNATGGVALEVAAALKAHPWEARVLNAQVCGRGAMGISHALRPGSLTGIRRSRPEEGEEAAEAPPALAEKRRRTGASAEESDVSEAVRATRADDLGRRAAAFQAAARLEVSSAWLDGGDSLLVELIDGRDTANACTGMVLGAVELGPAFLRVVGFVRAACGGEEILGRGSDKEAVLVRTAVECGLAMVDAMGLPHFLGGPGGRHSAQVAAAYGLTVLSGLLRIRTALAEHDGPNCPSDIAQMVLGAALVGRSGLAERAVDVASRSSPDNSSSSSSSSS